MDYEVINAIVKAVVLVICAVITRYVVPMIKAKVDEKKLDTILYYAQVFVEGVEKKEKETGAGKKKLAEVTELLSKKALEIGLKLSAEDIRLIIENAVKIMQEHV